MNHNHVRLTQLSPIPLNIEFSCNNGEIFVIVGPSGSGKTTILRSIAGLYKPAIGKVICQNNVWYDTETKIDLPVQKRAVGFVFQNYALFPHLTVRENIEIATFEKNKKVRNKNIDELLDILHLEGLSPRLPYQLSGGQQQRVAVARGLARKPEILLLDEPFSSVDQQTRRYLVRELAQLRDRLQIPIIHVTHDLNEARRIADKLCIINNGASLQIDSADKVMMTPANAEVARLTGHDNVFRGTLKGHDKLNNKTYILWENEILQTRYSPQFRENERLDWFIPSSQVIPAQTEYGNENVIRGVIAEVIQLGEGSTLTIKLKGIPELLQMNYSTHQAKENKMVKGSEILVSLLINGLHLMKQ